MKLKFILTFCILVFIETSEAVEYIFQLQSGYAIKIITPDQTDLLSAISTGQTIHISISSNNPQQEQLDQGAGFSLINSLLPEAIALHQQYLNGQIVHSGDIQLHPIQMVQMHPVVPTQVLGQTDLKKSTPTNIRSKSIESNHRYMVKEPQGTIAFPCSYPECTEKFSYKEKRREHHKTHFTSDFLDSLNKDDDVACPICQKILTGTFAVIMSHISKVHRQK